MGLFGWHSDREYKAVVRALDEERKRVHYMRERIATEIVISGSSSLILGHLLGDAHDKYIQDAVDRLRRKGIRPRPPYDKI
jgi:hypothetical protein